MDAKRGNTHIPYVRRNWQIYGNKIEKEQHTNKHFIHAHLTSNTYGLRERKKANETKLLNFVLCVGEIGAYEMENSNEFTMFFFPFCIFLIVYPLHISNIKHV